MKAKMAFLRVLALIMMFTALVSQPPFVRAADSTSFDPTLVELTAKSVSGYPIGFVAICPVAKCPEEDERTKDGHPKWLEANGQTINAAVYPELSAYYGPTVPDFRGLFLRGYGSQTHAQNNGSTVGITTTPHASGALGVIQGDATRNITGTLPTRMNAIGYAPSGVFFQASPLGGSGAKNDATGTSAVFDLSRRSPTAPEIRPANMAVRHLIRAVK